jgi:hypothetical protein
MAVGSWKLVHFRLLRKKFIMEEMAVEHMSLGFLHMPATNHHSIPNYPSTRRSVHIENITVVQLVKGEQNLQHRTASVVSWSEFLATDPEVLVRFPALPNFLRSSWSKRGSTQPHEYNCRATWKKKQRLQSRKPRIRP